MVPEQQAGSSTTRYESEARAKIDAGLGVFIRSDAPVAHRGRSC